MKSVISTWCSLPARAKDIIATVGVVIGLLVAFKASAFAYGFFNQFKTRTFVQTFLEENSPIAEMATRRIKWRVAKTDDGIGKTKVMDTVYVLKIGFDFSKLTPEDINVDSTQKTVTLKLPQVKVISVDPVLTRQIKISKKSFIQRLKPDETGVPLDELEEFCNLILDVEENDLLDAKASREGLTKFIGVFLKKQFGYSCTFLMNEKDIALETSGTASDDKYQNRVEAIFIDYQKEKGSLSPRFQEVLKKEKEKRRKK